jgi:hypothetical protein
VISAAFELTSDGVADAVGGPADRVLEVDVDVLDFHDMAAAEMRQEPALFIDAAFGAIDVFQVDVDPRHEFPELSQREFHAPFDVLPEVVVDGGLLASNFQFHRQTPEKEEKRAP